METKTEKLFLGKKIKDFINSLNIPWGGAEHCYANWAVKDYYRYGDLVIVLINKEYYCDKPDIAYYGLNSNENYLVVFNENLKKLAESKHYKYRDQKTCIIRPEENFQKIVTAKRFRDKINISVVTISKSILNVKISDKNLSKSYP